MEQLSIFKWSFVGYFSIGVWVREFRGIYPYDFFKEKRKKMKAREKNHKAHNTIYITGVSVK